MSSLTTFTTYITSHFSCCTTCLHVTSNFSPPCKSSALQQSYLQRGPSCTYRCRLEHVRRYWLSDVTVCWDLPNQCQYRASKSYRFVFWSINYIIYSNHSNNQLYEKNSCVTTTASVINGVKLSCWRRKFVVLVFTKAWSAGLLSADGV
jgi:hypothetical protein